jgi:DNA-binding winged helix-turn-helix (wHTH) protein
MASHGSVATARFDAASGELRHVGRITRLEPQPAAVLALLLSRGGELVTHDEIRRHVWGGATHVNFQDGVHYCVRQIRAALGDSAQTSRFIETVPRRGYRLRAGAIVTVDPVDPIDVGERPSSHAWRRGLALAFLAALLGIVVAFVERRPNNHHQIAVTVLKTVHDLVF